MENQNFGIQVERRVIASVSTTNARYTPEQLPALYDQMHDKLIALPGVEKSALALYTPLSGDSWSDGVLIEGRAQPGPKDDIGASWDRVRRDFFATIGEPMVRGRNVQATDTATSPDVAVVNQTFVKKFFRHGEDPIGQHFGTGDMNSAGDREIVGVVADAKYQNPRDEQRAMFFLPLLQMARSDSAIEAQSEQRSLYAQQIVLVTKGPAPNLEQMLRKGLASINPDLTVDFYQEMTSQVADQLGSERLMARLTLMFAMLALVLASVGLYGVTAYTVVRRTSEIGVRMALGAPKGSVVGMVLRGAMLQAGIGLAIGVPVALGCVKYVQSQLYNVAGRDLGVMAGAIAALATAACVAGLIPAQRAASVNPVKALRNE